MNRWTHILTLVLMLAIYGSAVACPMCKDSIPNTDAQSAGGLPGGFNLSVYYMLISLFAVIGLITTVMVKGIRSTNRRM